ncbi:hypothetical protein O3P69_018634 [Scylla paramamosain]|uniref:Uncharacterized protein n=1 Tax=Scylla paramamosain TaxID=85552 RepID=A0AAW0T5J5_SCYPA
MPVADAASQSTARARPVHTSPLTTYRSPPATWVVLGGSRGVFAAVLLGFIFIGSCPAMADRGLSRAGTPKPSQDTPRRASKPSQDTPRRAPQPSQDTPRRASQASQDTPRRASSSSSVSRDSSRPRRDDDDRLRKDNKRTAVGFDGSSVKRLCASKPQQPLSAWREVPVRASSLSGGPGRLRILVGTPQETCPSTTDHWPLTGCDINIQHLWYVQELAEGQGDRAHCLTIPAHHAPDKFVTWVHAQAPLQLFSRRGRQLESV